MVCCTHIHAHTTLMERERPLFYSLTSLSVVLDPAASQLFSLGNSKTGFFKLQTTALW